MLTSDFDYQLPEELIASEPLADRSASRMLVVHRESGTIEHRSFTDLPKYLRPDDLLVLNDTRVLPARYFSNDGTKELLRLTFATPTLWRCMVKPGKKLRVGHTIAIGSATGTVKEIYENGDRLIEFDQMVDEAAFGHLALLRTWSVRSALRTRSATKQSLPNTSSIAAPTAGLHFTPELLASVPHTFVTLHVGVGTFQPVKADRITDHVMHSERYFLSEASAQRINEAGRVIAVGTTATRVLESIAQKHGGLKAAEGETSIFIYPPYEFRVVDALVTNFHLPKSTLMMLVSALAGKDLIFRAYEEAIRERYRFYSYGDCMLIL
ncbi:tRNA preQ1(34) S-adenosylmethionine ribosyltransferase-isomerase QueA [Verrucomicrobium spinosum]|uniref:tRNA preQ1(34) S-adenosylmethionine ribosyltransferase-isomerase QueA n=1 Tax=Verrucomicrobium spinosum TaxID=2736 RepID=UPI0009467F18|nr:tRNA preQ1(34) S-adenosylmethionine ribosyltransferase-isomerase QueA [Verrucomicrobium spinosum]